MFGWYLNLKKIIELFYPANTINFWDWKRSTSCTIDEWPILLHKDDVLSELHRQLGQTEYQQVVSELKAANSVLGDEVESLLVLLQVRLTSYI